MAVLSWSVCHYQSLPPWSNIYRQGWELNIGVESCKRLHSNQLHPCQQISYQGGVTHTGKHSSLLQQGKIYKQIRYTAQAPDEDKKCLGFTRMTLNNVLRLAFVSFAAKKKPNVCRCIPSILLLSSLLKIQGYLQLTLNTERCTLISGDHSQNFIFFVTYKWTEKARVFGTGKLLQPIVM